MDATPIIVGHISDLLVRSHNARTGTVCIRVDAPFMPVRLRFAHAPIKSFILGM